MTSTTMTLDDVSAMLTAGQLPTVLAAQQFAAVLGLDPSQLVIPCEAPGCTNTMPLGQAHSFISCYATTGPSRVAAFQCPAEQHYGCSQACATAALLHCIEAHMLPAHAAAIAAPDPQTVQGAALTAARAAAAGGESVL